MLTRLDEDERYRRFDLLQSRMGEVWEAMRLNHADESVVVIPSITLGRAGAGSGTMSQSFEERFLFLLMLLRQPRLCDSRFGGIDIVNAIKSAPSWKQARATAIEVDAFGLQFLVLGKDALIKSKLAAGREQAVVAA